MGLFLFIAAFAIILFFGLLTLLSSVSVKPTRQKSGSRTFNSATASTQECPVPRTPQSSGDSTTCDVLPAAVGTVQGTSNPTSQNSPVARPFDPYQVLAVAGKASESQIRQAYSARLGEIRQALSSGQKPDSAALDDLREAFRLLLSKASERQKSESHRPRDESATNGGGFRSHQTGDSTVRNQPNAAASPDSMLPLASDTSVKRCGSIGGGERFVVAALLCFPFALANSLLLRWCILPLTNGVIGLVPFDQWLRWAELPIVGVFTALPLLAIGIGIVGIFILLACVGSFAILVASTGKARTWRVAAQFVEAYPKAKEFSWVGGLVFLLLAFAPFYFDLARHALPLPRSTGPMDILLVVGAIALLEGYAFPSYLWGKLMAADVQTSPKNAINKVPLTPISELMNIVGTPLAALSLLTLAGQIGPLKDPKQVQATAPFEASSIGVANPPRFVVRDTPISAIFPSDRRERSYFWLDDKRLLIHGFDHLIPKPALENNDRYPDAALYIYDTETGEYTRHTLLQMRYPMLCYSDGAIYYRTEVIQNINEKTRLIKFRTGKIGEEVDNQVQYGYDEGDVDRFTCRPKPRSADLLPQHQDESNWVIRLKEGDGYIYVGRFNAMRNIEYKDQDNNVLLYLKKGDPIELPIKLKEFDLLDDIHYSEYLQEYVISTAVPPEGNYGVISWPLERPWIRYFLSKDGSVRKVVLPADSRSPLGGSSHVPYPTKQGLYFEGFKHGSWMYRDGRMYKISNGSGYPSVSPNGCKMAVLEEVVRIFDFCDPKAKQTFHKSNKNITRHQ